MKRSNGSFSGRTVNLISLIGGAGIGAVAMYLLDPEQGRRRREVLAHSAATAAHNAGEALGTTWHGLGETAHAASQSLRAGAHHVAEHGRGLGESISSSARRGLRSTTHAARGFELPSFRGRAPRSDEHHYTTNVLLVAGALAAGAGLMMLLDPNQGARRRAMLRDKVVHGMHETSDLARRTGRYIADHTRGIAAETRARLRHERISDEKLEARVRSEMGHSGCDISNVNVMSYDGRILLCGSAPSGEVHTLVHFIRNIRGVRAVDNQLNVPAGGAHPSVTSM